MPGNMLGDCGDTNTNQVCPCPKEVQKPIGERDLGKGKGTEGQLEMSSTNSFLSMRDKAPSYNSAFFVVVFNMCVRVGGHWSFSELKQVNFVYPIGTLCEA